MNHETQAKWMEAAKAREHSLRKELSKWKQIAETLVQDVRRQHLEVERLTADADAFRLAAEMQIEVKYFSTHVEARCDDFEWVIEPLNNHSDACAAVRAAIKRAAEQACKKVPA